MSRSRFRLLPSRNTAPPEADWRAGQRRPQLRLVTAGDEAARRARQRRMRWQPAAVKIGLIASGWLAFAAQWITGLGPVRPALTFAFVLLVPGAAIVHRMRLTSWVERLALTIGMSVAIAIPVSETYALAHDWSPAVVLATLTAITTTVTVMPRHARSTVRTEWRPLYGPHPITLPTRRAS